MDHKVSKDMISSGMIPSGEKTQADLGKTQYGSAPSPSKLMDAYKSMYDKKEEVINEHHKKDADGNTIPHEDEELNEGKIPAGLQAYLDKKKGKKEDKKDVKEEIDTYDIILDHFLNEGYEREDILKVMSTVNLTEEPITATLAAIGAGLMKGAAVAAKGALVAGKAGLAAGKTGLAAAGKGIASGSKAAMKGVVSAAKPVAQSVSKGVSKATTGVKDLVGKGTTQIKKVVNPQPANKQLSLDLGKAGQSQPTGGSGEDRLKRIKDFAKGEIRNKARQEILKDREVQGTNKTSIASAQKSNIAASADLFDIVKGQLLDEGLSEEEIKDIMLTLTPDEILSEIKDYQMDSLKRQTAPGGGKDYKIEDKKNVQNLTKKEVLKPFEKKGARTKSGIVGSYVEKPTTEEYKNYDPKNPDPKQVAAQAQQEKNRQKANDPLGVKNTNIGGRGKDLG